jgi:hypothetical protein
MSGSLARRGFRFQDLYLLRRILDDTARTVAADIGAESARTFEQPLSFGIEATTSPSGSPDWDSIISSSDTNEVIEAKSGAIAKTDRMALWRRLRREIASGGDKEIRAVLVADPTTENLSKWEGLGVAAAARLYGDERTQSLPQIPDSVRNVDDLLDEAVSEMCSGSGATGGILTPGDALKVLAAFTVESVTLEELEASVLAGIELLFPDGLSAQLSDSILGWLNRRATEKPGPRRLLTTRELLGEMAVLQQCAAFDSGTLARWKALWKELPTLFRQRARTRLGKAGQSISIEKSQPTIAKALDGAEGNIVVLGPGGSGKTALLAQLGRAAEGKGAEVFECSADAVSEDEISDLFRSLRFKRALLSRREPERRMYVVVDALDEADMNLRTRWAKQLARFGTDSRGTLVASIRDHAWRNDGITRRHLTDWPPIKVEEWSEELVRDLLNQRWPDAELSTGLIELIRQPLMLDLFWRTFIEDRETTSVKRSFPETRHQLLSLFWTERILRSPRYQLPNLQQRLEAILAHAAVAISAFENHGADTEALDVLLSESVVLPEGHLDQKYRFRHPLLRDFAMALWCLSAPDNSHVAERWSRIKAGLQRHGALRAVLEALGDPLFTAEHPHLSRAGIITAILGAHEEAPAHVAQVLGTFAPDATFDPAMWPRALQDCLPRNFASELVTAARLAGNIEWAKSIASWPMDVQWIDDSFVDALLSFVGSIRPRSLTEPPASTVLQLGRVAAATLRQLSEQPRFVSLFETNDRWRKMAAMQEIIPLLPDESTLAWVEREMPVASWRTRGFLLDKLIPLAKTDPGRTASVYRTAIGLRTLEGFARVDPACWADSLMEYHAIDWSLAGKDQHKSLLEEFPEAFLPLAFELAEALTGKDRDMRIAISAKGLVNDHPDYDFWREGRDHTPAGRCIRAIQKWSEHLADSNPALFFSCAAPLFRAAKVLSLHSIYLDINLKRMADNRFRTAFIECLLDAKLYGFVSLIHWLESGLTTLWQSLAATERASILANIEAFAADKDDAGLVLRSRFFACLPQTALSPEQQAIAAERLTEGFRPFPHPRERFRFSDVSPFSGVSYEDQRTQGWPESFDQQQLQLLSNASSRLAGADTSQEVVAEHLPAGTAAAIQLLPVILADHAALDQVARFWVLDALEDLLEKHRNSRSDGVDVAPPETLVRDCANLALTILETTPNGVTDAPEGTDTWYRPETVWCHALALADSALVCVPAKHDPILQARFERVLVEAFQSGNAGVQVAISWSVRPWHWLHSEERHALHDKLVWRTPRQASVLISSLVATQNETDKNRTAIYRMLLERRDIDKPEALAKELGELCGRYALIVFNDVGRSSVADLAREVIDDPNRFSLLQERDAQVQFLHSFAFGMKEVAKHHWDNLDLVADFSTWSLKIWRRISPIRENRQESEGVILFAMHWLEANDPENRDVVKLRAWWQQLLPLVHAVAEEGNRPDCFTLFFNLRDPKMHHVLQAEELLDLVELLVRRLTPEVQGGRIDLNEVDQQGGDYNSWREILRNAAEALESGRADGLLPNDWQREKSRSLLAIMAAPPFDVETARKGLYHLHNEAV